MDVLGICTEVRVLRFVSVNNDEDEDDDDNTNKNKNSQQNLGSRKEKVFKSTQNRWYVCTQPCPNPSAKLNFLTRL